MCSARGLFNSTAVADKLDAAPAQDAVSAAHPRAAPRRSPLSIITAPWPSLEPVHKFKTETEKRQNPSNPCPYAPSVDVPLRRRVDASPNPAGVAKPPPFTAAINEPPASHKPVHLPLPCKATDWKLPLQSRNKNPEIEM
ncbi:hypothetical protein M0R45_006836 [Rubus argutus]|uniref:Uncharacterized protein n=1 Tax=Rubus argutus TaxID=59490 RepID=A0AAW1YSB7_RUBAR